MSKTDYKFTITVWKEGKHYIAQCLNVDISSFGSTYKAALANIEEALELYLEDADPSTIQQVEMPAITTTQISR